MPKALVIVERFRFYKRNQAVSESITSYVAEPRKLSIDCNFGEQLDDAIRD